MTGAERGFLLFSSHLGNPERKPLTTAQLRTLADRMRSAPRFSEDRELVAADYGAPTTRKRFVLVARCDGKPIVWPERTHAPRDSYEVKAGKLKPWRSAAEIIDWSLPGYSIFASSKEIWDAYGVRARCNFL